MTPLSDRGLGDINSCLDACDALPDNPWWNPFATTSDAVANCYATCNTDAGISLGPAPIPSGTLNFLNAAIPISPSAGSGSSNLWIGVLIVGGVILLSGKL
jgi:hypothetical protein